eukprot:363069-Chlamydomonas_euryale.AAC.2
MPSGCVAEQEGRNKVLDARIRLADDNLGESNSSFAGGSVNAGVSSSGSSVSPDGICSSQALGMQDVVAEAMATANRVGMYQGTLGLFLALLLRRGKAGICHAGVAQQASKMTSS